MQASILSRRLDLGRALSGPRLTTARRRVLEAMSDGAEIHAETYSDYRLSSGDTVPTAVVAALAGNGWITAPATAAPLFGWSAVPGKITPLGRARLASYAKGSN